MAQRICPCGAEARNRKGPPACEACRAEKVRLTQLRHRDKTRGSVQRGFDEPKCVWCGSDNSPRSYEVLAPKKFCTDRCKQEFSNEQRRQRTRSLRRCACGALPVNRTGIPNCEPCRRASKKHQARSRNLRPYGITVQDYDRMLAEQRGKCAICRTDDPGHGHVSFAVDHDHVTGAVRGLLCRNCNLAIGLLQDDPGIIRAALAYVEAPRLIAT